MVEMEMKKNQQYFEPRGREKNYLNALLIELSS